MTGDELRLSRIKLGQLWGYGRACCASELGRAIGNPARDPGEMIRDYERKRSEPIPWLLATSVGLLLRGALPPGGVPKPILRRPPRRTVDREVSARPPMAPSTHP